MVRPGNRHCANCIGALLFPVIMWLIAAPPIYLLQEKVHAIQVDQSRALYTKTSRFAAVLLPQNVIVQGGSKK